MPGGIFLIQDDKLVEMSEKEYEGENLKSLVPRVVGQTQQALKKKSGSRRPKLTRETFLAACDENGKDFYLDLFEFVDKNDFIYNWGFSGFTLNITLNGRPVMFMDGYSYLSFKQSVYTAFRNIKEKIKNPEPIIDEYRKKISELGLFHEVGKHRELKWEIREKISQEKKEQFFNILMDITAMIKEHGLI